MYVDEATLQEVKDMVFFTVDKLRELNIFLEGLKSEGRLEEYLEEERDDLMTKLNSIEYLLELNSLYTYACTGEVGEDAFEVVEQVQDETDAGLGLICEMKYVIIGNDN